MLFFVAPSLRGGKKEAQNHLLNFSAPFRTEAKRTLQTTYNCKLLTIYYSTTACTFLNYFCNAV